MKITKNKHRTAEHLHIVDILTRNQRIMEETK